MFLRKGMTFILKNGEKGTITRNFYVRKNPEGKLRTINVITILHGLKMIVTFTEKDIIEYFK